MSAQPMQTPPGAQRTPAAMLPPNIFDPRTDGSDYYWYDTLVQGLASTNTVGASQIQIDAGTDFYWIATTYSCDNAGASQTSGALLVPLVTVLINDTGTSRNLMNQPIPISVLAGDGREPYRLVRPRLFRANSVINFTYAAYVAAGTTYTNLHLTLHGYRRLVLPPGQ